MSFTLNHSKYLYASCLTTCMLFIGISLSAQNINNGTSFFIPAGTALYADGNIVNSGFIQNGGKLEFTGDWLNSSVYQGQGTLILSGSNQLLSNNNQPIAQLIADGGGLKTIKGNVLITNRIDFNSGIVLVRTTDSLTLDEGCQVNNASISSYVDGALMSKGTGYRFYPVGKNGNYHPVELTEIKGITPVIAVEVMENTPHLQTASSVDVYEDIYWRRQTISGTFQDSPITLTHDVASDVSSRRLVILEGQSLTDEFKLLDNVNFKPSNSSAVIGSRDPVSGNIFAVGVVPLEPPRQQYISTTLSPNADNPINRVVRVFGDNPNPSIFSFQVFNRWGIMVYENHSYSSMATDGWDGRQQGTLLTSGVYPYNLKMVDISGNTVSRTGFITIIN